MTKTPLLLPRIEGKFDTFSDWLNLASTVLTVKKSSTGAMLPAICVDSVGRRCWQGKDFQRAKDENTFPVYYFWECRVASIAPAARSSAVNTRGTTRESTT